MEEKHENQCVVEGCGLDRYEGHDKCILHCEKDDEISFPFFPQALIQLINSNPSTTILKGVIFPKRFFQFKEIVNKHVIFEYCRFNCNLLLNKSISSQFEFRNCNFFNVVSISKLDSQYLFSECKFYENINIHNESIDDVRLTPEKHSHIIPLFILCTMYKTFSISNIAFNDSGFPFNENKIQKITFYKCFIRPAANFIDVKSAYISESDFLQPIIFKCPSSLYITESTIHSIAYQTSNRKISSIALRRSSFRGSIELNNMHIDDRLIIFSSKFESQTTFSGTKTVNNFSLYDCLFMVNVNFIGLKINPLKTTQETFRLIKHSFDSMGNTIEANKYFALEMDAHLRDLPYKWGNISEILLLWINKLTSNFGQNWCLSFFHLIWFNLTLTGIHTYVKCTDKHIIVTQSDKCWYNIVNIFAKFITPLKDLHFKGHEFLTLIIGVANGILIYQTIVALKRKTRR